MPTSARSYAAKGVTAPLDQSSTTLASGINASTLTIPLTTGGGAKFPQPYNSTATSGGTATTLNCTGISAMIGGSAQEGNWIWNATDGSWAMIKTVSTNSLTTTALLGGSDNLWDNSDAWRIDPFVVTFAIQSTSAYGVVSDTTLEEALVIARSTDTLTVASGGRGFNGTTAASFSASDVVQLRVTTPVHEGLRQLLYEIHKQNDTNATNITTANTNITNLQTGAYFYVVTTGSANAYVAATPALAAYAAGNIILMKANFTNTGAATINLNSLGAKAIKKNDGATALAANDIISGQIVALQYDGTNFQMLSPIGTPPTATYYHKAVFNSVADSATLTNPTSSTAFNTHTYTIPANELIAGVWYTFEVRGTVVHGASGNFTLGVGLGASADMSAAFDTTTGTELIFARGTIMGKAAAGASAAVSMNMDIKTDGTPVTGVGFANATPSKATNGTLALTFFATFGSSHGSNTAILTTSFIRKESTTLFS